MAISLLRSIITNKVNFLYEFGYKVADFLTFLRLIFVFLMLSLIPEGESSLDTFMFFVFGSWLTDILDGFFARKSKRLGYLGKWDGWVDSAFYVTTLLYSTSLGLYSFRLFFIILVINFLAVFLTKNLEVNQAFHFLYILLGFRALYIIDRGWFIRVLIWTLVVIVLKWSRLKEQIKIFINSWKNLLFGKKSPSH